MARDWPQGTRVVEGLPRAEDQPIRPWPLGLPAPLAVNRLAGWSVYLVANALGVAAFGLLLWRPQTTPEPLSGALAAPVLLGLLAGLSLLALAVELGAGGLGSRAVAVLGVLVAMNAALRFAEVALPGPAGFSPIFVLIVLAGYAYGSRFGFLTGALTLVVSALITGGVGPWLPFQMYGAGWVGLTAGWLPGAGRAARTDPALSEAGLRQASSGPAVAGGPWAVSRRLVWGLALFGAAWGIGYGLLLTLWDWSFVDAAAATGALAPSTAPPLVRYATYYLFTSLGWDAFRAGGTFLLVLLAGGPLLIALQRFGLRFRFELTPARTFQVGQPVTAGQSVAVGEAVGPTGGGDALAHAGAGPERAAVLEAAAGADLALPAAPRIHARAWLGWSLGLAALASMTRNPLLLLGAVLAVAVTRAALPPAPDDAPRLPLLRLGLFMVVVAGVYNFFMAHGGQTVLLRLPLTWPLMGGPLTLEALIYGALNGLALATLVAVFATLRLALESRDLVRLVPRAFGALALVVTVALAYAPATMAQWSALREAQALRGRAGRGLRDWAPLVVPLVVGGLERALATAESLAARGLSPAGGPPPLVARLGLVLGMAALLVGWVAPAAGWASVWAGRLVLIAGAVLLVAVLVHQGRRFPYTDLRACRWRPGDSIVVLGAWLPVLAGLLLPGGQASLVWLPYPVLAPPPLSPALALALAGLALPALIWVAGRGR